MPFRKNFFGEQIIQPGTEYAEIDNLLLERFGIAAGEISIATIYKTFDQNFKIGGEIVVFGQNIDGEEGVDDPIEQAIQFDNFGTIGSAREWLDSLGVTNIEEVE